MRRCSMRVVVMMIVLVRHLKLASGRLGGP
jgi:hypothetical protein